MKNYEFLSFPGPDTLAQAAAAAWLEEVEKSAPGNRPYFVALSGGRITQKFFAAVEALAATRKTPLDRLHFFWADERCVPPTDAESNYRLAHELLFEPLNLSAKQIHRIRGEEIPETAARLAATEMCSLVPLAQNGQPVLDLIFLGLGEDGHIASLFPGEPESLIANEAVFRAIKNSPKPPPNRVTLGYGAIAAARSVWMLASGPAKEDALRESLSKTGRTPFARILQSNCNMRIFSDFMI